MIPLFALCSCGNGATTLSETEAKAQVATMKEEVKKDDFKMPTSGQFSTEIVTGGASMSLTMSTDVRFNTVLGSRYIYEKSSSLVKTTVCYYEKDGKYYGYNYSALSEEKKELTEAEFSKAFESALASSRTDSSSLKAVATSGLDSVTNAYDQLNNQSSSSTDIEMDFKLTFTKFNESSFKFEATGKVKTSAGDAADTSITIEYENYLPKSMSTNIAGASSGEETSIKSTETYTWGSVDYIYPELSK